MALSITNYLSERDYYDDLADMKAQYDGGSELSFTSWCNYCKSRHGDLCPKAEAEYAQEENDRETAWRQSVVCESCGKSLLDHDEAPLPAEYFDFSDIPF